MSFSTEKSKEFYSAARDGNLQFVKALSLDPQVDLNWKYNGFDTPFFAACDRGHVAIVLYLLDFHGNEREEEIDLNLGNCYGYTPLSSASFHHEKVVEILLEDERIDVNEGNHEGKSPLWLAMRFGRLEVVKRMLASGREIEIQMRDIPHYKTPIEIAREEKRGNVVQLMEAFERNPRRVRAELRRELGYSEEPWAGFLFALVVYFSDGYLKFPKEEAEKAESKDEENAKAQRFFSIASQLPMDLQMVLCNRVFGLEKATIKRIYSEKGFRRFARKSPSVSSLSPPSFFDSWALVLSVGLLISFFSLLSSLATFFRSLASRSAKEKKQE